jgi:hypothetical protein
VAVAGIVSLFISSLPVATPNTATSSATALPFTASAEAKRA